MGHKNKISFLPFHSGTNFMNEKNIEQELILEGNAYEEMSSVSKFETEEDTAAMGDEH
jgi:hypothetical protein